MHVFETAAEDLDRPWLPCRHVGPLRLRSRARRLCDRMATTLIHPNQTHVHGSGQGGFILHPDKVTVGCSYAGDGHSAGKLCYPKRLSLSTLNWSDASFAGSRHRTVSRALSTPRSFPASRSLAAARSPAASPRASTVDATDAPTCSPGCGEPWCPSGSYGTIPDDVVQRRRLCAWRPSQLRQMLLLHAQLQKSGPAVYKYNEIVLDTSRWLSSLPGAIEAFFIRGQHKMHPMYKNALTPHQRRLLKVRAVFLEQFGLGEAAVPVLFFDPAKEEPFTAAPFTAAPFTAAPFTTEPQLQRRRR